MKKIKRILAVLMAMAMIMGLGMTAFAAEGASIEVSGITPNDGTTTIRIYKVVDWDNEANEWAKESWVDDAYVSIPDNNGEVEIDWAGLAEAIGDQTPTDSYTLLEDETSHTFQDLDMGAYLVTVTSVGGKTIYSAMGARTYGYDETTHLITAINAKVYAKGENYPLNKVFSDGSTDKIVGLGEQVSFDITTVFPSFDINATSRTFTITDNPSGLKIDNVAVYVGDMSTALTRGTDYTANVPAAEDTAVNVEFTPTYIGTTNEHAGKDVKVVVTATVTGEDGFTNTADSDNNHSEIPPTVDGENGTMVITKKNQDNHEETLAGAEFELVLNGEEVNFTGSEGNYVYSTESAGTPGTTTTVAVDANGVLNITGLPGGEYTITETKAPDGYALTNPVTKTISVQTANGPDDATHLTFDIYDTKLASLPETGGIGTTIFTIGGCIIMIAAAGLFFASRRKSSK